MPNKRFLGLGFTFTAKDQGLEKKLINIHHGLKDINDDLSKANRRFKSFGSNLKRAKVPKAGARGSFVRPTTYHRISRTPFHDGIHEKAETTSVRLDKIFDHLDSKTRKIFQDLDHLFKSSTHDPKKKIKPIRRLFADFELEFDKRGKVSEKSLHSLMDDIKKFANLTVEFEKPMPKVLKMFSELADGFKHWSQDIIHAGNHVLESFGIHLSKIIPPQLQSLFGFGKAVIGRPLKALMGAKKEKTRTKLQEKFASQIDDIFKEAKGIHASVKKGSKITQNLDKADQKKTVSRFQKLKNFIGGPGTKTNNVYKKLAGIKEDLEKDSKSGFFNNLKKFGKFFLAGLGLKLLSLFKTVKNPFQLFKNLGSKLLQIISKPFELLFNLISSPLKALFRVFVEGPGKMLRFFARFGELAAEIAVFAAAIGGFFTGLADVSGELKSSFQGLWSGIKHFASGLSNVGSALFDRFKILVEGFAQAHPVFQKFMNGLSSIGDFFVKIITMIFQGWKNIGGMVGSKLAEWTGDLAASLTSTEPALNKFAKQITDGNKDLKEQNKIRQLDIAQKEKPKPIVTEAPKTDLKQKAAPQVEQVQERNKTIQDQMRQNQSEQSHDELMDAMGSLHHVISRLSSVVGKTGNQPIEISIGMDARKAGFYAIQKDQLAAARNGGG